MAKNKKSSAAQLSSEAKSASASPAPSTNSWRNFWLGAAVIFLATFIAYQPVRHASFIWDDNLLLTENPLIKEPGGLAKIWFSSEAVDYIPLTLTSMWMEWRMWELNPAGYLMVNVLLHALGAVLLWRVLSRLKIPAAWFVALLFALHPVAVASVGWVSERKNTLSLVFYALTLLFYLRSEEGREGAGISRSASDGKNAVDDLADMHASRSTATGRGWYFLSIGCFALGLLSKPSVVVLPVVLLGCAWWLRDKISRRDILRSLPFFALSFAISFVTVWIQNRATGDPLSEVPREPLVVRLLGGSWGLWHYLLKTVLPLRLSAIYPRWEINSSSALAYVPGALWFGGLALCWALRRKIGRGVFFALAYFTLLLLPVLGFFVTSYSMHSRVADHWQYLALIGPLALVIGAGATWLKEQLHFAPVALGCVGAVIAVAFFALTQQRAAIHSNPFLLWQTVLQQNPQAWAAHNNLGRLYAMSEPPQPQQAEQEFTEAVRLKPDSSQTQYNLGRMLLAKDRFAEALPHLSEAVRFSPINGQAQMDLGEALYMSDKFDEAAVHFEKAIQLQPNSASAHNYLGAIYGKQEKFDAAIAQYLAALKLRPGYFESIFNLGFAYAKKGQTTEAEKYFLQALEQNPNNASVHKNLAEVYERAGEKTKAAAHFAKLHYIRGRAALEEKASQKAQDEFVETIRFDPSLADAHYQLGLLLSGAGKKAEATKEFTETVRLDPAHMEARGKLGQ